MRLHTVRIALAQFTILALSSVHADAQPGPYFVDGMQPDDSGDGSSWSTAKKSIQAAVDLSSSGETVWVTNGTYVLSSEIVVTNTLTISSVNGPSYTIIDGDGSSRCFRLTDGAPVIAGFTLTNGYAVSSGGAIECPFGTAATVTNCVITGNRSGSSAGGMRYGTAVDTAFRGNITENVGGGLMHGIAIRCYFEENYARETGGAAFQIEAVDCEFRFNRSAEGGGLSASDAQGCTFFRNEGTANGGGMFGGNATHCSFFYNYAFSGGGKVGPASNCLFVGNFGWTEAGGLLGGGQFDNGDAFNCVFVNNQTHGNGGGVVRALTVNCTLVGNSSAMNGGGMYEGSAVNSIIWNNTSEGMGQDLYDSVGSDSCSPDLVHGSLGNITNNPEFISAYHLSLSSPCLGAGTGARSVGTDLDGQSWRNPPSMGCDEPDPAVPGDKLTMFLEGPGHIAVGATGIYLAAVQGPIEELRLDFGDGTALTNFTDFSLEKVWSTAGFHDVVLWVRNAIEPFGRSVTQVVQVLSVEASAIRVAPGGNDDNDGTTWSAPKATLQAGVDAQNVLGGHVMVSNGTYILSDQVYLDKDIVVTSVSGPETTILDGDGVTRCFLLTNCNATIHGFTITNAYCDSEGGGMLCVSGAPIISDCTFINNHALEGGAIRFGWQYNCCTYILPKLLGIARNCRFIDNTASWAGGVSNGNMIDCLFAGNQATGGVGGFGFGSAIRCVFSNNVCQTSDGGGMSSGEASDCLFIDNLANRGGACSYSKVWNCTTVGNHALTEGGAFFYGEIVNSILWNNTAGSSSPSFSHTSVRYSSAPDLVHGVDGNITNAPGFASTNDYRLGTDSACIDAGSTSEVTSGIDLASNARVVGIAVDMGAYEHPYEHLLTASAGASGSVSPSGTLYLPDGASQVFTFIPDPHYHVDAVLVDGSPIASAPAYIWSNVQADGSLYATFDENMIEGFPVPIPELWMVQQGFSGDLVTAAWADQDQDGIATWGEYVAGTQPTNSVSVLRVEAVTLPLTGSTIIAWSPSVSGRTYRVHSGPTPQEIFGPIATAAYPAAAYTASVELATSAVFAIEAELNPVF